MNLPRAAAPVVDKLIAWLEVAVKMLPNAMVAVLVLGLFWLLSILIGRLVKRLVLRFSYYHHVATLKARLSRLSIIATGILLALDALSLSCVSNFRG